MQNKILWLTGLSGAGKTTIAKGIVKTLESQNIKVLLLDGDELRTGLNKNLGFSLTDRQENIRRTAEVAKLFWQQGYVVLVALITPTEMLRQSARQIIGKEHFIEVFISTPLDVCEQRDVKGLYKKARNGELHDFTGIGSPYERPSQPDIVVDTTDVLVEDVVKFILKALSTV